MIAPDCHTPRVGETAYALHHAHHDHGPMGRDDFADEATYHKETAVPLYRIMLCADAPNHHSPIESGRSHGTPGVTWAEARAHVELLARDCGTGSGWPITATVVPA